MSIYDNPRGPDESPSYHAGEAPGTIARPGLIWIPVAAILLVLGLIMATGFIFGDYGSRTPTYYAPEDGLVGPGQRNPVFPEDGPPLANDGY